MDQDKGRAVTLLGVEARARRERAACARPVAGPKKSWPSIGTAPHLRGPRGAGRPQHRSTTSPDWPSLEVTVPDPAPGATNGMPEIVNPAAWGIRNCCLSDARAGACSQEVASDSNVVDDPEAIPVSSSGSTTQPDERRRHAIIQLAAPLRKNQATQRAPEIHQIGKCIAAPLRRLEDPRRWDIRPGAHAVGLVSYTRPPSASCRT